ncbi:Zn(II)2Cys6 transcription factor [Aspergillus stella-maris]|uniref:Zn(II)2Cys6 transcription factor n=1 Tax=Aspergillus stella-maris TaxID=1810926 RepID=UPI003CCCBB51
MDMETGYGRDMYSDFLVSSPIYASPLPRQGLLTDTTSMPVGTTSSALAPVPRTNRVKRPHTKSRRGCYSCKSRRIKCQETRPACANCVHKDLDCVYPVKVRAEEPTPDRTQEQMQRQSPSKSSKGSCATLAFSSEISVTPFTGDDLRFWHHFLVDARPHLPFGDEQNWLSTVPAFAHDCPHLLHAMLSLGASHCTLIAPRANQFAPAAIAYRGKAIKSLSTVLAKGNECTVSEMDGALATCYTLTFQAHQMSDGVVDFAVMVRGCGLVTGWYFAKQRKSRIFNLQSREEMNDMIMEWLPPNLEAMHDAGMISTCLQELEKLQPFLQSPALFTFYALLHSAYESLLLSQRHAFAQLVAIYDSWAIMENIEFLTFIAPGNHISRALFIHYVTFDVLMRPVYAELARERNISSHGGGGFLIYRWAEGIYAALPGSLRSALSRQMMLLAMVLLPQVQVNRGYPQWERELEGFVRWLRKWVPREVLEEDGAS